MNQCVNEQMATRIRTEELAIDHMCDPREWMPVPRVKSGERPVESCKRDAAIHQRVLLYIPIVIESDELMPDYLRINPKRHRRQNEQDDQIGPLQSCSVAKRGDSSSVRRSNKSSFSLSPSLFNHLFARLRGRTTEISTVSKRSNFLRRPICVGARIRLQPARLPLK